MLLFAKPNKPADLQTLINQFSDVDIILVEGFKDEQISKIICHRSNVKKPIFIDDRTLAIASDEPLNTSMLRFDIK